MFCFVLIIQIKSNLLTKVGVFNIIFRINEHGDLLFLLACWIQHNISCNIYKYKKKLWKIKKPIENVYKCYFLRPWSRFQSANLHRLACYDLVEMFRCVCYLLQLNFFPFFGIIFMYLPQLMTCQMMIFQHLEACMMKTS